MVKKSVSEILYYLYFTLFFISSIVPSFFYFYSKYSLLIEFCILLFLFILNINNIIKDRKNFILILLIMLISIFSIIFSNGGIGSFLNLFHFMGGIIIFCNIKINHKMQNFIYFICGVLWIYNIKLSFNAWNLYIGGNSIFNPNSIGIFIFFTFIIIKSFLNKYNKKLLSILLFIVSAYCIFLTNCRSTLIAFVLYMVFSYIPIINKFILKHNKIIIYLIMIIGTIFPIVYVKMYMNGINIEIPFIEKKLYTGREKLWYYMLNAIKNEKYGYMLGLGTNYQTGIGVINNFHNWYIGVLYTFGFPVLCGYFSVLAKIISNVKKKEMLYGLIVMLVIGFTESVGFWTVSQTYIFMCLIVQRFLEREDT